MVTTLLDPQLYPAKEILRAYLLRWRLEMCLDDLKTTLDMESLRGRSPDMAQKELYTRLIAHNLIRRASWLKPPSSTRSPLERISFKGSLDALRQFSQAMSQARTKKKRQQLWDQLLETLAADLVPDRPGRREPRALKSKKNKYTSTWTAHAINSAIIPNATSAEKRHGCESSVLCKRHSPERVESNFTSPTFNCTRFASTPSLGRMVVNGYLKAGRRPDAFPWISGPYPADFEFPKAL